MTPRRKYQPQEGDEVEVVLRGRVTTDDRSFEIGNAECTNFIHPDAEHVVSVTLIKPAFEWQPGDVVRAANDDQDPRTWTYNHDGSWRLLGVVEIRTARRELPPDLTLLVRNGRPVPR